MPATKSDRDMARMLGTPRLPVSRRGSPSGGTAAHWLIAFKPTKPPPATAMKYPSNTGAPLSRVASLWIRVCVGVQIATRLRVAEAIDAGDHTAVMVHGRWLGGSGSAKDMGA
jgi:hypothetical protein